MIRTTIFAVLLSFFAVSSANATPPMLVITGNISRFTDTTTRSYRLSEADILALPQASIQTGTSWTPVSKFSGVKMLDLMQLVGAYGETVEFRTLDDYIFSIPMSDFRRYGVILARSMNGEPLLIKNYGPLWVIYPRDNFPKELNTPTTEAKFVWQVNRIVVR